MIFSTTPAITFLVATYRPTISHDAIRGGGN